VELLKKLLAGRPGIRSIMDYGCGTGSTLPLLADAFGVERAFGVDVSKESVRRAREEIRDERCVFSAMQDLDLSRRFDLVYCNGVFHHIPPGMRKESLDFIYQHLEPGGYFAMFENNPHNPATRYVMSRTPFDRDAMTLTPREAALMLSRGGFEVIEERHLFLFPRWMKWLRWSESFILRIPIGAQYLLLAQKAPALIIKNSHDYE
jgi:SAM-dependent methyltransferase